MIIHSVCVMCRNPCTSEICATMHIILLSHHVHWNVCIAFHMQYMRHMRCVHHFYFFGNFWLYSSIRSGNVSSNSVQTAIHLTDRDVLWTWSSIPIYMISSVSFPRLLTFQILEVSSVCATCIVGIMKLCFLQSTDWYPQMYVSHEVFKNEFNSQLILNRCFYSIRSCPFISHFRATFLFFKYINANSKVWIFIFVNLIEAPKYSNHVKVTSLYHSNSNRLWLGLVGSDHNLTQMEFCHCPNLNYYYWQSLLWEHNHPKPSLISWISGELVMKSNETADHRITGGSLSSIVSGRFSARMPKETHLQSIDKTEVKRGKIVFSWTIFGTNA